MTTRKEDIKEPSLKGEKGDKAVEQSSMDSFPASDPPGWTRVTAKVPCEKAGKNEGPAAGT